MDVAKEKKNKRLNILVSESLVDWAASTAEARGISLSAFVRQSLEAEKERILESQISSAADLLVDLYENDDELTAFTSLDGDGFS
ncbi:MAG: hypothetical protein PVF18_06140 [Anaerolineales bacterium]|jgi:ATP-dependent protease HslVU (ClpYQ) peptidase subunit